MINYKLTGARFVIMNVTDADRPTFHRTASCQPRQVGTTPSRWRCKSLRSVSYEVIFAGVLAGCKSSAEMGIAPEGPPRHTVDQTRAHSVNLRVVKPSFCLNTDKFTEATNLPECRSGPRHAVCFSAQTMSIYQFRGKLILKAQNRISEGILRLRDCT